MGNHLCFGLCITAAAAQQIRTAGVHGKYAASSLANHACSEVCRGINMQEEIELKGVQVPPLSRHLPDV